jgi:hypothetical protein
MKYFANLSTGRIVLWCYLLWYLFFATRYFEASSGLWLTSLGISGIIGIALVISTVGSGASPRFWPMFRLFLMPFCVSSFSALVKGRGFFLVFSPHTAENVIALALCAGFCLFVAAVKWKWRGR